MFRSLAAFAFLFAMTGCAADFAGDGRPESDPATQSEGQGDEATGTEEAAQPSADTDRAAPMKKQIICKKGQEC